jgi:outer membrane receptor protein involved in Fe transport
MDSWNKFKTTVPTLTSACSDGSGAGHVHRGELPGRVGGAADGGAEPLRAADRRVSPLNGHARVDAATGKYVFAGLGLEESRLDTFGFYAQDSWRVRPNLSLNLGVRWDVQRPFRALQQLVRDGDDRQRLGPVGLPAGLRSEQRNPQDCNLFKPGEMPGQPTVYERWNAGTPAYNTDWNNVAPSIGFNWSPDRREGLLGTLMGASGDFVIRGGFSRGFQQPGMTTYRGRFSANPGLAIPVQRNRAGQPRAGCRCCSGDGGLRRRRSPRSRCSRTRGTITNSVNAFDPNIQVPYADSWTAGIQRG